MRKVTIKGLLAHKLRLALTALAIVLGVTFISGTFVLTDTLQNTFTTLFGNIYANIDFQISAFGLFASTGHENPCRTFTYKKSRTFRLPSSQMSLTTKRPILGIK